MARRPRPRAGSYRDKYRIERLDAISGGYTSGAEDWTTLVEFRAETKTRRGTGFGQGEQELADALQTINTLEIVTGYSATLASVTPNDRLINVRTGKISNIKHVDDPDRRRETIYITAEEGRPNG